MITFLRLMLTGAYRNIVRVLVKGDRATSMDLRNSVLNLSVPPTPTVLDEMCIGCSGCFHVCPTKAISMVKLNTPVIIIEGYVKDQVPRIDLMKCIFCLNCHDTCPIYSVFGEAAPIHARDVGMPHMILKEVLKKPVMAPPETIQALSKLIPPSSLSLIQREGVTKP
ncbi:MAG: 4Fe-4S binding protein [Candidatus Methanomethylicus sp.]|nr:4Fe-4S binding protein [Candidatus Methanomethylicus sp.]